MPCVTLRYQCRTNTQPIEPVTPSHTAMPVTALRLEEVGPFRDIQFHFDKTVNVITGPNNTGKSTVLWALGELLVYPFTLPERLLHTDPAKWYIDISTEDKSYSTGGLFPANINDLLDAYRSIGYTCFIPAHRHATSFRSSGPTATDDPATRIEKEISLISQSRPSILARQTPAELHAYRVSTSIVEDPELTKRRDLLLTGAVLISDELLIQKIIDLDYAAYRLKKPIMRSVVDMIATITSDITDGFPIEFLNIESDSRGLFPKVRTRNGDLPLDSLSQGTMSIIHCLAYLIIGYAEYYGFPEDLQSMSGILIIDEIDAHLHPAWQRRFIPALTRHFPRLQVFCSSHSPLMLAGLAAGQIQLLSGDSDGTIAVSANQTDISGWTADEILRHLLTLAAPTDLATADQVQRLQVLRRKTTLTHDEEHELEALRQSVGRNLLSDPMKAELSHFAEQLRRLQAQQSVEIPEEYSPDELPPH